MGKDESAEGFHDLIQSPGEMLRQARLSKQLSIGEISKETRISRAMIEALENGENKQLPGRTYETSYIKLICKMTGHDPEPIVKKWSEEFYPNEDLNTYVFPEASVKEDTSYIGLIGLFLSLIIIIAYGAWYLYSVQNLSDEVSLDSVNINQKDKNLEQNENFSTDALLSKNYELNSENLSSLNSDQVSVVENNDQENILKNKENESKDENSNNLENISSNLSEKKDLTISENINSSSEASSENSINLNSDNDSTSLSYDSTEIEINSLFISGLDDSWVQIAFDSGEIFYSGMLKAGEKIEFPNDNNLNISLGNAGAVGIEYDGSNVVTVGANGEIIQSVKINEILSDIKNSQLN